MEMGIQLARLASDLPITDTGTPADLAPPEGKKGGNQFAGAALRRKRMVWTEAKDARLKELCAQGVPYDLMATDLSIEFEETIGRESVKDRAWKLRLRRTERSAWTPEIDADMLRLTQAGTTYNDAATILNAKYGTQFTRNSLIGRASRLGGYKPRVKPSPEEREARKRARDQRRNEERKKARQALGVKPRRVAPRPEREITVLRCAEIEPLHVSLFDLNKQTCRWPYGEGLNTTFCGHAPGEGTPYCLPHFHLSLRVAS